MLTMQHCHVTAYYTASSTYRLHRSNGGRERGKKGYHNIIRLSQHQLRDYSTTISTSRGNTTTPLTCFNKPVQHQQINISRLHHNINRPQHSFPSQIATIHYSAPAYCLTMVRCERVLLQPIHRPTSMGLPLCVHWGRWSNCRCCRQHRSYSSSHPCRNPPGQSVGTNQSFYHFRWVQGGT